MPPPDELTRAQQALNQSSVDRWDQFRSHREQLTALVLAQLPRDGGRVCVLGAGNCNDLDLNQLRRQGAELDLVDIDGDAVRSGLARQGITHGAHVYDGVDITGAWPTLRALRERHTRADLSSAIERAAHPPPLPLPGNYDVVLSPAVLTQLINSAAECVGREHDQLDEIAAALRAGHLRTMLSLTRPGGCALYTSEIISNREIPEISDAAENELARFAFRALMLQQVYKTTHPAAIVSWLTRHRPYAARLQRPGIVGPWRWWLAPRLCYLVVALLLTR